MEKKSFILYKDTCKIFESLSNEETGVLFKAIVAYSLRGEELQLSRLEQILFDVIRGQLDRDAQKWEETCEKRRIAGRKGGLSKGGYQEDMQSVPPENEQTEETYTAKQWSETMKNPPEPSIEELFEAFWEEYPKKTGLDEAFQTFWALHPDQHITDKMILCVRQYCLSGWWKKDKGKFIPSPTSFICSRHWEGSIKPTKPSLPLKPPPRSKGIDIAYEDPVTSISDTKNDSNIDKNAVNSEGIMPLLAENQAPFVALP